MFSCKSSYTSWSINKEIPLDVWRGRLPIVKTLHPLKNEWWGMYMHFDKGVIKWRFKPVPTNWLKDLFNAIFEVVSKIVDTVIGLLEAIMKAACTVAKPFIADLMTIASGAGTPAMASSLIAKGVKEKDLNLVKQGGQSQSVKMIAENLITNVCKAMGVEPGAAFFAPVGSITAFDPSVQMWRIAFPRPGENPAYNEVMRIKETPPSTVLVKSLTEYTTLITATPFYKLPWFWGLVGGVTVIGGVGYYAMNEPSTPRTGK